MPRSILEALPRNVRHFFSIPSIQSVKNEIAKAHKVKISVLRLDEMHPVISGNKLFKLIYYIQQALHTNSGIITYGGAFSNHLAATACLARLCNLPCTGIVRGESRSFLSPTLQYCADNGMYLKFISRSGYKELTGLQAAPEIHKGQTVIPEGGFSIKGAQGAAFINKYIPDNTYSHVCVSGGTATTLAGLLLEKPTSEIICFPAIKGMHDILQRLEICGVKDTSDLSIEQAYHFGGFGRINKELIDFMNQFHTITHIPLDAVYTGKMMFGVFDLIRKKKIPSGAHVLCIHTGGLQGNTGIIGLKY